MRCDRGTGRDPGITVRLPAARDSSLNKPMNGKSPRQSKGLPHNPGVRDLVQGKRRFSSPPKREDAILGFRGWHERGYLPHRDEPGLTQFLTFRLADSF